MRIALAAGITLMVCGVSFMAYLGWLRSHPPAQPGADGAKGKLVGPDLSIPAFSLIDQNGQTRDHSVVEGKVSVVWFMFTKCPLACPAMSVQAADLQKQLRSSGVQFVAFSLDPKSDRPDTLKEYGGRYSIDWNNWTFLTEPDAANGKRTGWDIYTQSLHQFAEERKVTDQPAGSQADETTIEHAMNFFLVGPDGKVIDWFNSNHPEEMTRLKERARGAAAFHAEKAAAAKR
ncbi:MAG: SCO family protein [Phycisphaerales bacterium]